MNFLPQTILERRKKIRLFVVLTAVQAVIFLCFILVVWKTSMTISHMEEHLSELNVRLYSDDFTDSEQIAAFLQIHIEREALQQEARYILQLPIFDIQRIDMITTTLPDGVQLLFFTVTETGATISARTSDLRRADFHRHALLDSGLVSTVQLDEAISHEGGFVRYTLTLRWQ